MCATADTKAQLEVLVQQVVVRASRAHQGLVLCALRASTRECLGVHLAMTVLLASFLLLQGRAALLLVKIALRASSLLLLGRAALRHVKTAELERMLTCQAVLSAHSVLH